MAYSARLELVDDREGLIVMASIFCLLNTLSVVFRFYARRLTRAGLGADDWLALVGLIFVLALNGIFIGGTVQGAITGHSPVVDNWPVTTELEHLAQKYKYAFQTTEKIAFGLIKLSLVFLWKRIFGQSKSFVIFCWAMVGILTLWSVAFFFATVFQCGTRWTWNWAPIGIFLTQCVDTLSMLTVFTATDLLTDFIIILMPVPLIWRLHMPTKKKVGVTSIFMVGLFTIGAGIARMYIYLVTSYDKVTNPDFIGDFTLFILWSDVEANVAILVCSMPTMGPVVGKFRDSSVPFLRSVIPTNWILLSPERASRKLSNDGTGLSITSKEKVALGTSSHHAIPWHDAPSVVAAAGYSDVEEPFEHSSGILTRTEISRMSEPKPLEAWRGRGSTPHTSIHGGKYVSTSQETV
ncbi:hypothetical protein F5X99DRAFT_330466 [Biscogniauxia marginata]|nr:hypothetical protein F5X99DRAFT_330466 [Biscogniauxia marginata]